MGLFNRPRAPQPPKEEAPPPPPPSSLTKEDVQAMIQGANAEVTQQLTSVMGELRQGIEAMGGRPVVVQQPTLQQPTMRQISDEEIDNAIARGESPAKLVRELVDSQVTGVAAGFERRLNELQEFGTQAIGSLQIEKLKDKPYYQRFKKDIDAKLGMLPAAYRANPDTIDLIYKSVIGENAELLEREAREAALRGGNEPANEIDVRAGGSKPGTGSGKPDSDRGAIPDVAAFGGEEALRALKDKDPRSGRDGDSFAQSMGYKDWAHYISQYNALRAEQGDLS